MTVLCLVLAASGSGLTYKWEYSDTDGLYWWDSSAQGAATDTLRIAYASGRVGYLYRCIITDAGGNTVTSRPAEIKAAIYDTWDFTYGADGLRKSMYNGTILYTYYYIDGRLSQMKVGGRTLRFTYDESGKPLYMTYMGTPYYYVTNLQGDVTEVLDADGNVVAYYIYDAWGKLLSFGGPLSATVGEHNPLRYRGYVYDVETGLYYLQSRYYDPEMGRFINADAFPSTGQGIIGNNMFAYCLNNPVNGCDPCGTCFHRWDFWNDCENCGGQTIKDKLIDYYDNGLTLNGSVGLYGSANLGVFNVTGTVEVAVDLKGNIQIIGSGSFDVTTAGSLSASGGATASLYAMPDTSYYAGDTYYMGGSVAVPNPACPAVAVGVGGNVGKTSDGYWGINGSLGIGTVTAAGAEFHGGYSRTVAITEQFNVVEWIISLF